MRIIRACREMGIETVAVYSEADKEALHTKACRRSHLHRAGSVISELFKYGKYYQCATVVSGADAIHPGFGFLSENSKFAELCEQCGITFIGPPANVIAKLGNKQEARNTMMKQVFRSSQEVRSQSVRCIPDFCLHGKSVTRLL